MKKVLFLIVAALIGAMTLQAQNPCAGPTNLIANPHVPDYRNVTLSWTPVNDPSNHTISLSDPMTLSTRIGWSSGSAVNVITATRFLPSDLAAYHGYQFTAVKFAPGVSSTFATFAVMIWQGGSMNPLDTTFTPGTLIYNQPVNYDLTAGELNIIPLNAPITIDSTQELWVAMHIVTLYGYPIYATSAPADGSQHNQNLVGSSSLTSWHPLNVSGAEYNWCIGIEATNSTNMVQGYNIYRNQTLLNTAPTPGHIYIDSLDNNGTFQYSVTAVYANSCESSPISATVEMNDDTCYIFDLPFTENFDSHPGTTSTTSSTNNLPECWHHIAGAYTSYSGYPIIYNSSTYSSSGSNSLRFYTTTTSTDYGYQVAILPPMDIMSYPMNTLQLEFDGRANATTSNFTIVVGVMDNYHDLSTFMPIDTFTSNSTSYTNFVTDFSQYTGNGAYIALMAPRDFVNNYGYVDNILIYEIPSCPKPRDITSTATSQNSVTLAWSEVGSAMEWDVEYGPSGFRLGEGTRVSALTNPTTITGLSASLTYDFYVRSVCGFDDTSMVSGPYTVTTDCGNISQLPYSQNFDAFPGYTSSSGVTNLTQFCWTNINTGSSYPNYPIAYSTSSYAHSEPNSLRFYSYYTTAYDDQYAVMPALDPSIQINTVMLEYKARLYSTSYPLHVIIGVMSDSSDVNTFVPVDTLLIPTTAGLTYRDYITMFNHYNGTGRFIAFKGVKPTSTYMAGNIDDIVLSYIPTCMHPTDVTITSYTSDEVTVNWQPLGNESIWEVVVVPSGSSPESGIIYQATEYPYTVDMLSPETNYDVYVRAYCSATDYSTWAGPVSFRTRCSMTSDIPYVEYFDSYGTATSTSVATPGPIPTCWDRYTNYTTPYPYISSSQHSSGVGALYFYSTSAYYSMAVSQQLDISNYSANSLNLSFELLKTSANYGRLQVGLITNPDSLDSFTILKNIYSSDFSDNNVWTEFNVVIPNQYTTPVYLAFRSPAEITSYVFLDNVKLEELPTCSEPRHLAVGQIQGTSAMVTWEEAFFGTPVYVLQYSELGMDNWSAPITVSGTRYMLSGLTPSTSYEVRVYSDCSSEVSDTVSTTFITNCLSGGSVVFDDGTATTYLVPLNNYYKYSYTQEIFLSSEMNGPADIKSISFDYSYATPMSSKTNVNIYLGHTTQSSFAGTTDYIPFSNLQLVYSGSLNCTQGWNTFLLNNIFHYNGTDNLVLAVDDNSNAYNGSAYVFHYQSMSPDYRTLYYYSDSYNTDPTNPPAAGATVSRSYNRANVKFGSDCDSVWVCAKPNVYVSSVNNTDVTLNWAAGDSENSWAVEYKSNDDYDWTSVGVVYTNTYTFSNLNSGTNYEFRVCALCSSVDSSVWSTVSAFIPCASISSLPYTQGFESATGSGAAQTVDICLTRGTNSTTAYPYPSNSYAFEGTYSLYFYGASSIYSYLALPKMDESIPMDSLMIQFQALKTSAAYYVEVGIMEDPDDITTFTTLASFSPSETSTTSNQNWEMGDCMTNTYTGNGRYVAFRIPQAATSYVYLDNILVDYLPSCLHVTNLHVNDVTSNSVEIAWTPGQDEQTWYYVYGLKDSVNLNTATWLTTTANPLTITGLAPNTPYDIYVAADCNEPEPSQFMRIRVYTSCDPISSIPYYENFDDFGGVSGAAYFPRCWYRNNTYSTTTQYPYLSTSYSTSSPQSIYFYSIVTTTPPSYSMAVTNELLPTINMNTLQVRFNLRSSSASYYMQVGVVTDPEEPNTFTLIDTVMCSSTTAFEEKVISLANYTGNGRYIAFKGFGTMYFDDLWIEEIPNCDAPENIVVSGITNHEATLNWTAGNSETEWEVYVFPEDSSMTGVTPYQVQNSPTLSLTGLTSGTKYQVYLRAVCPNNTGYSHYIFAKFVTLCDPMNTLPYTENFDGIQGSTSTTIPNNLPLCWSNINTGTSYPGYPIVYNSTTYSASGANSMRFYIYSSTAYSDQYAIMPGWDVTTQPLTNLQLKFDVRQYSTSYPFVLLVGVMSDPSDVTTFELVDSLYLTNSEYETRYVYFDNYTGNGSYITFLAPKLNGTYNEGNIDNIELSLAPTCRPVRNLHFEHFTPTSVDVVWEPVSSGSSWIILYRELNGTDSTWLPVSVTGTPSYTLMNLEPNTPYEVMVQADCGGGDYSIWTDIQTFRTECNPITAIPYFTNFDNYTGTTSGTVNNLPSCWHFLNTGTTSTYIGYPIIYNTSSYAASGSNTIRFYTYTTATYGDEYAIFPEIDTLVHPINTLQIDVDIRKYSTSYATFLLLVGVMSDPYDANTFVTVDSIVATETTYVSHTSYLNNYPGGGSYIAFKAPQFGSGTYNAGNIDNLSISIMPQCLPVRNVAVSNISSNSAEVSWIPNGTETSWWLKYKANTAGAVADSVYVTSTTYTLTNLNPATSYSVEVKSDCGSEMSIYSAPVTFSTECVLLTTLPFSTNFDSYTGTTSGTSNNLPDCWHYLNTGTLSTYAGYPIIYNSSSYASSGSNSLRFYTYTSSTSMGDQYAILPGVDVTQYPMNTLQIEFDVRKYSTSYATFTLSVGVMSDPYDLSTFELVDTLLVTETSYSHRVVRFNNYQGNGAYVTLMAQRLTGVSYNSGNIDNLVLKVIPCSVPESLAVNNVTTTSAAVSWTPAGLESAWNLQYKAASASSWTLVSNLTTPSYTLTNLQANTTYQVQVQANCGSGVSGWTSSVSFTTMDDQCAAPTNLHLVDTTNMTATLDWNQSSSVADEWTVYYKKSSEDAWSSATANTHPYVLLNLEPGQTYNAKVTAHCTNGAISDPSETITFTTSTVGVENYELEQTEVYPNPTTGQFTIHNAQCMIQNVEVYDVYGKKLCGVEVNDNMVTLDGAGYAPGVYFIRISTDKGMVNRRIVKK